MNCNLAVFVLFLVIVDNSRSSEVQQSVHDHAVLNGDILNKKLLPDVKHLLKENNDGSRQKFLHLLSSLEVDGYKFVNGKAHIRKYDDIELLCCFCNKKSSFNIPYAFICSKSIQLTSF